MCTPDPPAHAAPRASSAAELDFQRADCAFRLGLDGSLRLGLDGSLHPALGDVRAGPAHGSPVARPVHHGVRLLRAPKQAKGAVTAPESARFKASRQLETETPSAGSPVAPARRGSEAHSATVCALRLAS